MGFKFSKWVLNDIRMAPFFAAILDIGDTLTVPPRSLAEFERQRALKEKGDQRAWALKPWLCWNGGLYGGAEGKHGNNGCRTAGGRRTPEAEEANMRLANEVLRNMKPGITALDWLKCLEKEKPGLRDLIAIDYPLHDFNRENILRVVSPYVITDVGVNFAPGARITFAIPAALGM
jgi:hypothetical protein